MVKIDLEKWDFKKLDLEKIARYLGKSNQALLEELRRLGVVIDDINQPITDSISKALVEYLSTGSTTQNGNTLSIKEPDLASKEKLSSNTLKLKSKVSGASLRKGGVNLRTSAGSGEILIKTRSRRHAILSRSDLEKNDVSVDVPVKNTTQSARKHLDSSQVTNKKTGQSFPSSSSAINAEQDEDKSQSSQTASVEKEKSDSDRMYKMTRSKTATSSGVTSATGKSLASGQVVAKRQQQSKRKRLSEGSPLKGDAYSEQSSDHSVLEGKTGKILPAVVYEVTIPETITVSDLAQKMSIKAAEVIKVLLMDFGAKATINQPLDQDTATMVVEAMGHKVKLLDKNMLETNLALEMKEMQGEATPRPPVVTIMGHVDHGKTSLLDYIRNTNVLSGEAGGITQHIGAYHVVTAKGTITFLDTPGHEAFTAMRARGAKCTDIIVLVVAADDGVMPQTREAIQHARAANVPIIVAINKIDKPEVDIERVKSELAQLEVMPEDWGGDVIFQCISAKTGQGVDNLLESILLQAEIGELKAFASGPAKGVVVESRLDKGRGPVSTVLVQQGTLKKGNILLAGCEYGRVRDMLNSHGERIMQVGPSMPVGVFGLSGMPQAGDGIIVMSSERKAREVALFRRGKARKLRLARHQMSKIDDVFSQVRSGDVQVLNIVLKADTQGSVEAITGALEKLVTDEVKVCVIAGNVGGINESDVNLALASKAILIGFNVRADVAARRLIEYESVELKYYSVIYELIDEVKAALAGLLPPTVRENIVGLAEVKDVFRSSKLGAIAGCVVTEGVIKLSCPVRVLRDNVVLYKGPLTSLRRFKDEVQEVREGMECGMGIKDYNDIKQGDQIENYDVVEERRQL